MKRFIIIIAAVAGFAFSANAQTYYDDGELSVSHDTFCLNGMPLDDGQVLDLLGKEVYDHEYLPAKKKLKTAGTLEYIGGTMIGFGIGCAIGDLLSNTIYGGELNAKSYITYGCISLAGVVPAIIGSRMSRNGMATYARIAESYNRNTGKVTELTLSPAKSGLGIALNF